MKKIVTIGGGGGHAQVLKGIRHISDLIMAITAICPSTDSGGSTGILARDYGCLGFWGDLTKCMAALCPDDRMAKVLMHRFQGGCLDGHSLKNILLLALEQTSNSPEAFKEALGVMHDFCGIPACHQVLPVTMRRTELRARLRFGNEIRGETNIDNLAKNPLWHPSAHAIEDVYLCPSVVAFDEAINAIINADYAVICPGDLYSSVIPVLLPAGISAAFSRSKQIVVILNITTKRGETDRYDAEDFLREIEKRLQRKCDAVIVNSAPIPSEVALQYRLENKVQLTSGTLVGDPRVIAAPLITVTKEGYVYHDPVLLADVLMKVFDLDKTSS